MEMLYSSAADLSVTHVSIERQIRESYGYTQPVFQFFRDHPEACHAMCMAIEQKLLDAVRIYHHVIQDLRRLEEQVSAKNEIIAAKNETIESFGGIVKEKDAQISDAKERLKERDMFIEEKNRIMEQRLEDKNLLVTKAEDAEKAKDKHLDELRLMWKKDIQNEDKDTSVFKERLEEKDAVIQAIKDARKAETGALSVQLESANTENLRLSGNLSVRGMIEKIEYQYSSKRRRDGVHASRKTVWTEILDADGNLKQAVSRACFGRNAACKVDAAIEAIDQIYKRVSDEIHNAGYDVIPVRKSMFHGVQLEVLRGLCAAAHYAMREYE